MINRDDYVKTKGTRTLALLDIIDRKNSGLLL